MFNRKLKQELYDVLQAYSKLTSQQSVAIINLSNALEEVAKLMLEQDNKINILENKIESITKSTSS